MSPRVSEGLRVGLIKFKWLMRRVGPTCHFLQGGQCPKGSCSYQLGFWIQLERESGREGELGVRVSFILFLTSLSALILSPLVEEIWLRITTY